MLWTRAGCSPCARSRTGVRSDTPHRDLALSQPTVSNQVAQLERELGVPLLSRGSGGLELSAEGRIVLEHADVIEGRLELARTQVAAAARGRGARLRIGAFPTALATLVPRAVHRLRQAIPTFASPSTRGPP